MYRTSAKMLILTFAVLCITATFVLAQTGGTGGTGSAGSGTTGSGTTGGTGSSGTGSSSGTMSEPNRPGTTGGSGVTGRPSGAWQKLSITLHRQWTALIRPLERFGHYLIEVGNQGQDALP